MPSSDLELQKIALYTETRIVMRSSKAKNNSNCEYRTSEMALQTSVHSITWENTLVKEGVFYLCSADTMEIYVGIQYSSEFRTFMLSNIWLERFPKEPTCKFFFSDKRVFFNWACFSRLLAFVYFGVNFFLFLDKVSLFADCEVFLVFLTKLCLFPALAWGWYLQQKWFGISWSLYEVI